MKAMLAGFAASVVIAIGAWYGANHLGFSSEEVYTGTNVRLE
ncbi:hypothetical protein [Tropicimonas sediminicola]|uniref:Uncharacterized protein n=1 Tax=Tropicimonas sediminicola TaxID=1031541 RepID=A0A239D4U7_9RHOB|nr:hypothetical protein [Tropicimonas sediminicola]SNS27317.1 hypothetical protein SAMN05421757_101646 [Tropicimonas sediminicola]